MKSKMALNEGFCTSKEDVGQELQIQTQQDITMEDAPQEVHIRPDGNGTVEHVRYDSLFNSVQNDSEKRDDVQELQNRKQTDGTNKDDLISHELQPRTQHAITSEPVTHELQSRANKGRASLQNGILLKIQNVDICTQDAPILLKKEERIMSADIKQNGDHEVTKSLVNDEKDNKTDEDDKVSSIKLFRKKLNEDKTFRQKLLIFVSICYSFLILGMNIAQFGPTLLDLQKITGCSLDQASFFFNGNTIGYLVASMAVGLMFDKFNKLLLMFVPSVALSVIAAIIPFCTVYEVMVVMHVLKGFCMGITDAVGNALVLHILSSGLKTYMQILHFMFAFGGIISPLISAPFLSKPDIFNETSIMLNGSNSANESINYGLMSANFTDSQLNLEMLSGHIQNITLELTEDSEVYKAYLITAVLTLTSAIPFLILLCRSDESTCPTLQNHQSKDEQAEKISNHLKIPVLVILCVVIAMYTATEDTFAGFLTTFTVKHFNWSKTKGAFATSVFWTSFAVGRFSGIFIVNLFRQVRLLYAYVMMINAAFVCLLVMSIYHIDEGIWLASAICGFGMSIFFPMFYSWVEETFFHVDGKLTALIMTCACIGVIINPIILSRVMDTSPIWFGYMLIIESGLLLMVFLIAIYISRFFKQGRPSPDKDIAIDVETADPLT